MASSDIDRAPAPFFVAEKETVQSHTNVPAPTDLVEFGLRRTLIVLGIMLAVLLEILDTTIVNVALPTIQGNIGANLDDAAWIVTAYLIAVIIALPLVPWFESLLGRKRYCVFAIIGFTLASAACGLAQSLPELVAFRIVQGFCGGGILTIARTILRDTFPPHMIGASQGLLGLGAVVGPSIGPTVGGMLTDAVSWRWVFFINVLPGIVSATLLWTLLREPKRARVASDAPGIVLLAVGLGSLQYVLESGERNDWFGDERIVAFTVAGVLGTLAFVAWELFFAREPVVDLRILTRRAVLIGCLLSFGIGFTLFAGIVLGPQFSQGILGFTATLSGNQVLVRAVSIAACIPVAVISLTRLHVPAKYLVAIGFGLVGWSGFLLQDVTTSGSDFWAFGAGLSVGGFGFGFLFVPISVAVLSAVSQADGTKASAMLSMFQQFGASVSTAALVTVVDRASAAHLSTIAGSMTLGRGPIRAFLNDVHGPVNLLASMAVREATTLGFADAYWVSAIAGLVLVPLALVLPRVPDVAEVKE